jgi:hypothetical protein
MITFRCIFRAAGYSSCKKERSAACASCRMWSVVFCGMVERRGVEEGWETHAKNVVLYMMSISRSLSCDWTCASRERV